MLYYGYSVRLSFQVHDGIFSEIMISECLTRTVICKHGSVEGLSVETRLDMGNVKFLC
jgi:hypothetical protein